MKTDSHLSAWSYWTPHLGPSHWKLHYREARGCRQSPINISDTDVDLDCGLIRDGAQLQIFYDRHDCCEIQNVGFTWKIMAKGKCSSYITAGYLHGTYVLHDVHAHWGTDGTNGSEHVVNGRGYAAEVHIVHYNAKYSTFEEAVKQSDGLAVLAIFLKESSHDSKIFTKLGALLAHIPFKGQSVPLPRGFDIRKLIPDNNDFWTYHGSLTTPPCCECVTWTIFRHPINITPEQLDVFRSLHSTTKEESVAEPIRICNNTRPVQQLHNRPVRCNFKPSSRPVRLPPISPSSHF